MLLIWQEHSELYLGDNTPGENFVEGTHSTLSNAPQAPYTVL